MLLFQKPNPPQGSVLGGTLPITPSLTFSDTAVTQGTIHLDILAGREGVRGSSGGSQAVTVSSGGSQLSVAKGSLAQDTAINVETETSFSSFDPSSATVTPLAEVVVDFSGQVLNQTGQLSVTPVTPVASGATLVVARVDYIQNVPMFTVVALAQVSGATVISAPYPGLPGIVLGARYVFFQLAAPVGFVSGVTSSSAGPIQSVVTTQGLPFIGVSAADGTYTVAATAGSVSLSANVPLTSLQGSATATVTAGQTTPGVNISLSGSVTTATASPADGATGVDTGVEVQITTSAPISAATAIPTNVQLFQGDPSANQPVGVRLVLSGSGTVLGVIPVAQLNPGLAYTLQVSSLADAYGGLIVVPTSHFTTKTNTPPVYDVNALTFSFPDANGLIQISAPAGTFPPGTTILIIDSGNGVVLTLTAGNDGAVTGSIPGTINDQLVITITDPAGNVTTVTKSQFVNPATGQTAVGPGGGTVTASDGSGMELQIPQGALQAGTVFNVTSFTAADVPAGQMPDLGTDASGNPVGNFGGGLKIDAPSTPTFAQEAKLAFPKPQTAPDGAFYYVYRKLVGPNGVVNYETLDHAFIDSSSGKVVTASPPFPGYTDSIGGYDVNGAIANAESNYNFLMWTYNQTLPGKSPLGAITGKVLRAVWNPGAQTPTYMPVAGAIVSLTDGSGNLVLTNGSVSTAISQADGRYTLIDSRYTGGGATIAALIGGVTETATVYEINPADPQYPAFFVNLVHYKKVGLADIAFPAIQPPPAPAAIDIQILKAPDNSDTHGFVTLGTPLTIRLHATSATVTGLSIEGQSITVAPTPDDPTGQTKVGSYAPAQTGSYTATGTALPPFGGALSSSKSFLVVSPGGGNNQTLNAAPAVIDGMTVPQNGATNVPITVFPQVAFTQPVTNVTVGNSVTLIEQATGSQVAFTLLGIDPNGNLVQTVTATSVVTSLTLRPITGLKYGTVYQSTVSTAIADLETGSGNPKHLQQNYTISFTTFGPQEIAPPPTNTFGSPGIVVLGTRAYLVKNNFQNGYLMVYDVSDPVNPTLLNSSGFVQNLPVDIAGIVDDGTVLGHSGNMVAIATGPPARAVPSNLYVFDASTDQPFWVAAVSLTSSAEEGDVSRIFLRKGFAYAATFRKGIQVVDLVQATKDFAAQGGLPGTPQFFPMIQALNTDGQGFDQSAVVQSIPVPNAQGTPGRLYDLKVGDFTDPQGQVHTLAVTTGYDINLATVEPSTGSESSFPVTFTDPNTQQVSTLNIGEALALGTIGPTPVAVVVGYGSILGGAQVAVLAVVDMTNPQSPQTKSIIPLSGVPNGITGSPTDVLITSNGVVLVGTTKEVQLVNVQDLSHPIVAGLIGPDPTTGLPTAGGRLALNSDQNILFSTAHSAFGGSNDPLGGIHDTALGRGVFAIPLADSDLSTKYRIQFVGVSPDAARQAVISVNHSGSEVMPGFTASVPPIPSTATAAPDSALRLPNGPIDPQLLTFDGTGWTVYLPQVAGSAEKYTITASLADPNQPPLAPSDIIVGRTADETLERQIEVAETFAPIFIQQSNPNRQDVLSGQMFEDYFLRFDFDGDWNGFNNTLNLNDALSAGRDLRAFVYYSIVESEFHYVIHYTYYHARDPKSVDYVGGGTHDNDLEGVMVVVQKSDARQGTPQQAQATIKRAPSPLMPLAPEATPHRFGKVVLAAAQAHNNFFYGDDQDQAILLATADAMLSSDESSRTHPVIVASKGSDLPPPGDATHIALTLVDRLRWVGGALLNKIIGIVASPRAFDVPVGHGASIGTADQLTAALTSPGVGILYVPSPAGGAVAPSTNVGTTPVPYVLLPTTGDMDGSGIPESVVDGSGQPSSRGLWDRRGDDRIFGSAGSFSLQVAGPSTLGYALYGRGCKANMPWGWTGESDQLTDAVNGRGALLTDPFGFYLSATDTLLQKHGIPGGPSTRYISNVYWRNDLQLPQTAPLLGPDAVGRIRPSFQCACSNMQLNFTYPSGMDSLGLDPGSIGAVCTGVQQ